MGKLAMMTAALLATGCGGGGGQQSNNTDQDAGPGACPVSAIDRLGRCYETHWSQTSTWLDAEAECQAGGGTVAGLHSDDEAQLIRALTATLSVWIGCDANTSPACAEMGGKCAYLDPSGGVHLVGCDSVGPTAYVCELPRW